MNTKILTNTLILLLFLWGLMACTSEEHDPSISDRDDVILDLPLTKGNGINEVDNIENRVTSARLIVFSAESDRKVFVNTKITIPTTQTSITFREPVKVGYLDIFIFMNELDSWSLDDFIVGGTLSKELLKNRVLSFTNYPPVSNSNPIPMYGSYERVYVDKQENIFLSDRVTALSIGSLTRLYAKASVKVKCTYSDLIPSNGGDPIELRSIHIKNMPSESYLIAKYYQGSTYNDGSPIIYPSLGGTINVTSDLYTANASGFEGNFSFFIPEYLLMDTARRCCISLNLGLINAPGVAAKEYKLIIGNGIGNNKNTYLSGDNVAVADLQVTRNTHYSYTANVISFSESSDADVDITAEIVPWNTSKGVDDPDITEYYLEISPASTISIGTGATTGVFTILTDYTGGVWSIVPGSESPGLICTQNGNKLNFSAGSGSADLTVKVQAGSIIKTITIKRVA